MMFNIASTELFSIYIMSAFAAMEGAYAERHDRHSPHRIPASCEQQQSAFMNIHVFI